MCKIHVSIRARQIYWFADIIGHDQPIADMLVLVFFKARKMLRLVI